MFRVREVALYLGVLGIGALGIAGCTGDKGEPGPTGPEGPSGEVSNATCLASGCHGNPSLEKLIVNDLGNEEIVPLYVDAGQYETQVHADLKCVACHTDINASGGAHSNVYKTYGGWARFGRKQAVEAIAVNEIPRTRNYYTAASRSCATCHTDHAGFANSAHATIFKMRESKLEDIGGHMVGEDYEVGNCNRCHTSCSTCHFQSTISRLADGSPLEFWDENQTSYPAPGFSDAMSEFEMDWTTNVATHAFRRGAYFDDDSDGVCEACHTGFQKPAATGVYWLDDTHTEWGSIKATNVKRHPQTYELIVSGNTSFQSGGSNTAHAGFACADCHGGSRGDVHGLPGLPYEWSADGDVQCTDCHSAIHANGYVALHLQADPPVACIGCHTFGLGRDFDPTSDAHDVFIDPVTNEIRPVVYKHGAAIAWYAHNWQTLDGGTGVGDLNSDCAEKCHYPGNMVGASGWQ